MANSLVSRLGSEALGTLFFVFLGGSAAVSTVQVTEAGLAVDRLPAALGFALALAVSVWIFSAGGGHLNPWVTIGLALRGKFSWAAVPGHVIAQLVGGFVGALLVWALFSSGPLMDNSAGVGTTHLNDMVEGADYVGVLAAEALVTLVVLVVVFNLIDSGGWRYGLGYGLSYGLGVLAIGAITGASMNFARTLGTEVTASIADSGLADWGNIWVYLVGPAVGVALAWLVYPLVSSTTTEE